MAAVASFANRSRVGSTIIPGDILGVSEVTPALFAPVAAQAETTEVLSAVAGLEH